MTASLSIVGNMAARIIEQQPGIGVNELARTINRGQHFTYGIVADLERAGFRMIDKHLYPPTDGSDAP